MANLQLLIDASILPVGMGRVGCPTRQSRGGGAAAMPHPSRCLDASMPRCLASLDASMPRQPRCFASLASLASLAARFLAYPATMLRHARLPGPRRLMGFVIAALAGCHAGGAAPPSSAIGGDIAWPYWPTAMRIHPLTRVVAASDANGPLIEARIEFTDRDGITTRAIGEMQIELLAPSGRRAEPLPWTVDLTSLVSNATHFDDITRTYLFKLGLEPGDMVGRRELRVTFFGSEGREFTDRMRLELGVAE
jgi:hypothetical protein